MDVDKAQSLLGLFFKEGQTVKYKKRCTILGHGEKPTEIFYIVNGTVKVVSYLPNGNERIHHIYGHDEIFPVTWLFGRERHSISFMAMTEVVLRARSFQETLKWLDQNPYALLAILEQQSSIYGRIINLNMGTAEQRVSYWLVTLAKRLGQKENDRYVIHLPITIQEIADMVRLTRETAGKVLSEFEERGDLLFGRKQIVVNLEKIEKQLEN